MKLLLYACLFSALCFASCAKDNVVVEPDVTSSLNADMAYLSVTVSTENPAIQNGGCAGNERCVLGVEDALVVIYLKDGDRRPPEAAIIAEGMTDDGGQIRFDDLEHQPLMIDVISELGATTLSVNPMKGVLTRVNVQL